MSKKLHISYSRLSHLFRNEHGIGIRQYLTQHKIAKAKCLLAGNDKIETIAGALGYQDKRAFLRQFKKATKLTPTEYRRALLNDGGSKMFDEGRKIKPLSWLMELTQIGGNGRICDSPIHDGFSV